MTQEDQEENSQAEKSSVSLIYVTFTKVISCDFFSFLSQKESKGEAPQTGFYSLHWPVLVTCSKLFSMLLIICLGGGVSLGKAFKNINNQ